MPTQARYQIRVYSPVTGEAVANITNWLSLNYVKQVNDFHTLQLVLGVDDLNIQYFVLDALVEVWRQPAGRGWYREITTMFRTPQYDLYENGHETFTIYCRGLNDLLHRRHISYPATTAYTLKSGPADDVMKAFVRENCTSAAVNAIRKSFSIYDPTIYGFTVSPDSSLAPIWSGARSWLNLLDVLNDISLPPNNVDFEVIRMGNTGFDFQFSTFYPLRGIDRSLSLTFAPELGNMSNVKFTRSRTEEANIVFVLGQGENTSRIVLTREASDLVQRESFWNAIEITTDARGQETVASLTSQGDELLEKLKAQDQFEFQILQTDTRQYGIDYDVGDKVKAKYHVTVTKKIIAATVNVSDGKESISLDFVDTPSQ